MDIQASHYHDFSVFTELRREAQASEGEAIEPVAKQFESLFVQMMLKSMRDTVPESELLNDESMRFYQDMMDKQLSVELSEQGGIGLAESIQRQLTGSSLANGEGRPESASGDAVKHQLRRD